VLASEPIMVVLGGIVIDKKCIVPSGCDPNTKL